MEQCKCGRDITVKTVVQEVTKEVEVGDNAFGLRILRGFTVVIVCIGILLLVYNIYVRKLEADERRLESEELQILLNDPSIKLEIQEAYRAPTIRKFSR